MIPQMRFSTSARFVKTSPLSPILVVLCLEAFTLEAGVIKGPVGAGYKIFTQNCLKLSEKVGIMHFSQKKVFTFYAGLLMHRFL